MNSFNFSRREWYYIAGIILIGLAVFAYKIHVGVLDYGGDYTGYVATGQFFAGLPGAVPSSSRVLKPLEPALNALLAPLLGWRGSFLFIVGLFYALLVGATWLFFKAFFSSTAGPDNEKLFFYTASATALFSLSYPMLRYGLDAYTETGALFFYILGLLGVFSFLKRPTMQALIFTSLISVLGFLWKEYAILPVIIMQFVILWHPLLKGQTRQKIKYLAMFDALFLACNLLWQTFVYAYFHYTYFDWYAQGGASGFHTTWSLFIVIKSLFALLIAGWFFVPFGFAQVRRLQSEGRVSEHFFFWLIFTMPLICLGWGAVSSRLFYVCVPALILLCLWGIVRFIKSRHDQATLVLFLLALDFAWLFFHL